MFLIEKCGQLSLNNPCYTFLSGALSFITKYFNCVCDETFEIHFQEVILTWIYLAPFFWEITLKSSFLLKVHIKVFLPYFFVTSYLLSLWNKFFSIVQAILYGNFSVLTQVQKHSINIKKKKKSNDQSRFYTDASSVDVCHKIYL